MEAALCCLALCSPTHHASSTGAGAREDTQVPTPSLLAKAALGFVQPTALGGRHCLNPLEGMFPQLLPSCAQSHFQQSLPPLPDSGLPLHLPLSLHPRDLTGTLELNGSLCWVKWLCKMENLSRDWPGGKEGPVARGCCIACGVGAGRELSNSKSEPRRAGVVATVA